MARFAAVYAETSLNPLAKTVELTEEALRIRRRRIPLAELNMPAMADAYLRGSWLGGGGHERPLAALADGPGIVPVARITGSSHPVRVHRAAEFAHALGEMAVRHSGGPERVAEWVARAHAEGVPLWMARRSAEGPCGPVTVAVDRRSVRADVWAPHAPVVRLRAPFGLSADRRDPSRGLALTIGGAPANVIVHRSGRKAHCYVAVESAQRRWELRRERSRSSRLLCNGRLVATLARPWGSSAPDTVLLPLARVRHENSDPL
ncbi:hypothetical protein, partial [Streptomyces sp. URMC 123]|uniref:hypothetical protein n=1 Tax=Streptomyces sp. URMC 123 TaxID=3423403 RepID=UPI003F1BA5F5